MYVSAVQCAIHMLVTLCFKATGSWDYTVHIWSVHGLLSNEKPMTEENEDDHKNGDVLHVLKGHLGNIRCLAFSKEGMLVS